MKDGEDRILGVIEAITAVTRQCPHGSVVAAAEQSLAAIKEKGADAMAEQAFLVLSAIKGWRGDVAQQVHRSLQAYLDDHARRRSAATQAADTKNAADTADTAETEGAEGAA